MASDGYINKCGNAFRFGITVSKKDQDIIDKLKKLLKYEGKAYAIKTKLEKTGKEYDEIILKVTSNKIVQRLSEFGLGTNKTKRLSFPTIVSNSENEEIIKAFIQGFFEGDGSILFDEKQKSPCFQIVGTKEMLKEIQHKLINYLCIGKTKLTKYKRSDNHFALRYRGKFQAIKIMDWLYSNPENYLDRKYNKYLEIKRRLLI